MNIRSAFLHKANEDNKLDIRVNNKSEFFQLMTLNNPDLLFVKDRNFRIVEANPAFLNVYPEEKRDKVIGYTTLEDYNKEEADVFLAMDRKAFEQGYSETLETIHFPDGNKRTLYTQKIRFENRNGEPFILGIGRDVTEQEEIILELSKSHDELEYISYLCTNDLREQLEMVASFANMLTQSLGVDKLDDKQKYYLERMNFALNLSQEIISDVLVYSPHEDDKRNREDVDINEILKYVISNLKNQITISGTKINFNKMPIVKGRHSQLILLFQGLIDNAIRFRGDSAPYITITAKEGKDRWEFAITDNGIGIDPGNKDKIFMILHQLDRRKNYTSTSLNLALCKKIVERHGGRIWAESVMGRGSTIHFILRK